MKKWCDVKRTSFRCLKCGSFETHELNLLILSSLMDALSMNSQVYRSKHTWKKLMWCQTHIISMFKVWLIRNAWAESVYFAVPCNWTYLENWGTKRYRLLRSLWREMNIQAQTPQLKFPTYIIFSFVALFNERLSGLFIWKHDSPFTNVKHDYNFP